MVEEISPQTSNESPSVLEVLAVELKTFRDRLPELLENCLGRWALVKGQVVVCVMDTSSDAVNVGYKELGNVPFLVGQVHPLDRAATFVTPPEPII